MSNNPLPYHKAIDVIDDASDLLRIALAACNQQARFRIAGHDCDSYQLATRIEALLSDEALQSEPSLVQIVEEVP